jgi:hypothetical protein
MVSPPASNLEIPRRVSLPGKATPLNKGNRCSVSWLDIRFKAMQSQLAESVPHDKLQAFRHVALALMSLEGVVAEIGAQKSATNDIRDIRIANKYASGTLTNSKRKVVGRSHALETCPEGRCGPWRMHPDSMEALARRHGCDKRRAIGPS